jgi:hypothetical protein
VSACDGLERAVKECIDLGVSGLSSCWRSCNAANISTEVAAAALDAALILDS